MRIWRAEFRTKAYRDQTGAWQEGYVIFEQVDVVDTEERFDVDDGYSVHPEHGRICVDARGRKFRVWSETVDYAGGTHVVPVKKSNVIQGYWMKARTITESCVDLDGRPIAEVLVKA